MLESNLPRRVDPTSVSLSAKIPFKALIYREVLIWRFVELTRSAFENYTNSRLGSATVLTRAAVETTAALWYLDGKIGDVIEKSNVGGIDEHLMRLLCGYKNVPDMPDPINVLTFVDRVDKKIDGFRSEYDELSEFAHPNWCGTSLLYSKDNKEKIWTDFGNDIKNLEHVKEVGTSNLVTALEIFDHKYNRIADMMPEFIKICECELEKKE